MPKDRLGEYRRKRDFEKTPEPRGRGRRDGRALRGTWALTRFRGQGQWLLVKTKDDSADARRNLVQSQPQSVKTGRTIADVAAEADS